MTTHRLPARRENLHGTFHRHNEPVLRVSSGDVLSFQTLEVGWRTERVVAGKTLASVSPRDPILDDGPALTGPVLVEGAEPGSTLELQVLELQTGSWGWTSGGGPDSSLGGEEKASLFWDLDQTRGVATNQHGQQVTMNPFLGTVGLASADLKRTPGWKPHPRTGGNMDANVLTAGSSLFLPVEVPGGLLSVGDAHAAQGDGEVSGTAIECPMEEAVLRVVVHPDMTIGRPRALCHGSWATFGLAETLDEAAHLAMEEMLDLMCERSDMSRSQALALASSVVDLRVTQMVNPLKGVHAVVSEGLLS